MITLVGSCGSMGVRYQAILNYLDIKFQSFDKWHTEQEIIAHARHSDGVIIATPTHTHVDFLSALLPVNDKVLCEKPITKNIAQLEELTLACNRKRRSFNMVMQYRELVLPTGANQTELPTSYDYFRHGQDGLAWDCMQVIGLAKGVVELKETSPIWRCIINGQRLTLSDMDSAYVRFTEKWLNNRLDQSMDEIIHVHKKTHDFIKGDHVSDD